jgi:hypothetical protein
MSALCQKRTDAPEEVTPTAGPLAPAARYFRGNQQSINAGRQQWETVAPALAGYLYAALSELPRGVPHIKTRRTGVSTIPAARRLQLPS